MIRFFLILSLLLLNFEKVCSEEEGLSRQEKNLLRSIDRIDKKNEALGKTLSLEIREKFAEEMKLNEAFAISSGLTMITTTVEGTELTFIYRANLDISNYRKKEIQDLQDFLFKKVQENGCSEPLIRSMVFVFDITFHYEFIDITNKPFGREMNFTKADCKGIKTKGSPVLFPEAYLKIAIEE
jgi:hypothetical protein